MFIDVTRLGGVVLLRVAAAAIAYLTDTETGCAIRLIGGETIRANESRAEIEERVTALSRPVEPQALEDLTCVVIDPPPLAPREPVILQKLHPGSELTPHPRHHRGRNKR